MLLFEALERLEGRSFRFCASRSS